MQIFFQQSPVVLFLFLLALLVLLFFLLFIQRKKRPKKTFVGMAIEAASKPKGLSKEKKVAVKKPVVKKTELEKYMAALHELRQHKLISLGQFYKTAWKLKRQHG